MRPRWVVAGAIAAVLVIGASTQAQAGERATRPSGTNTHQPTNVSRSDNFPLRLHSQGPAVRRLQQQLVWLGFDIDWKDQLTGRVGESTLDAVQDAQIKYFWRVTGKVEESVARQIRRIAGRIGELPSACMGSGPRMCADKTQKVIRFVEDGRILLTTDVRFGVADGSHDTPEGSYSVWWKDRDAVSRIDCGAVVYEGCLAPMPAASFFNGDIAVHYSPTFNLYGYYPGGGSHGCINVRSEKDAYWMFDRSPYGTPVIVYS